MRPADQLKAIEMLLDRGFGRSPQQLDIAHNVSDRPLEHLSDETLRLLVENARQLKKSDSVVVDVDGQVVTQETNEAFSSSMGTYWNPCRCLF